MGVYDSEKLPHRSDAARRSSIPSFEFELVEETTLELSGEDHLLADERDAIVRVAIDGLPKEQAEVVRLSFFAQKPHAEIARDLGIPLGTVKSRLRLALAKIRAVWEKEP